VHAVTASGPAPFRGRQAEARRNDERILEAALEVFAEDPQAPMSAVTERAGVGQASLYRRYPSKEALLARVCEHGMTRMRNAALGAIRSDADPWDALTGFLRWYLESGTPQLGALLGSFAPAEHLFDLARETNEAMQALVERTAGAGRLRDDVTGADLTLIVTQISALDAAGAERAAALRDRYLTLALQGLALRGAPALPGPAPDAAELVQPWRDHQAGWSTKNT
jgi:AcrR family transcriptional regulator